MATRSEGARRLRTFLKTHKITAADAARALDVSAPTMGDWLKGTKRPRETYRRAIAVWTGDAVPADAWALASDARILTRVKPFVAAPKARAS